MEIDFENWPLMYEFKMENLEIKNPFKIKINQESEGAFSKDLTNFPKLARFHFKGIGLEKLLYEIESLNDPLLLKEALLRSLQLYFDGLNNCATGGKLANVETWEKQSQALSALINGVKISVGNFYRNNNIPYEGVRNTIQAHKTTILTYGSTAVAKDRHLDGLSVDKMTAFAKDVIVGIGEKQIETIVPIASGGFEPGLLMMQYLGVESLLPVRCSMRSATRSERDDDLPSFPTLMPSEYAQHMIAGRKVLIVDDITATGLSLENALRLVRRNNPSEIYFATIDGFQAPGLNGYASLSKHVRKLK